MKTQEIFDLLNYSDSYIYPGNFNKALIIQLNQLAHNSLGK